MRHLLIASVLVGLLGCSARQTAEPPRPAAPPSVRGDAVTAPAGGGILSGAATSGGPGAPGGAAPSGSPGAPEGPGASAPLLVDVPRGEVPPLRAVGPQPTADAASWVSLPTGALLNAMVHLGDDPATALPPEQAQQALDLLLALEEPVTQERVASTNLRRAAAMALSGTQVAWLEKQRPLLHERQEDLTRLPEVLSQAQGPERPGQSANKLLPWSADELAAGLVALQESPEALSAGRARTLLPAAEMWRQSKQELAAAYVPFQNLMTPKQLEVFTARLVETRKADSYPATGFPDHEQAADWLRKQIP